MCSGRSGAKSAALLLHDATGGGAGLAFAARMGESGVTMTTPMRWLASVALVLAWLPLHAEVIQLKNGNKITGKLTAINGDTFVVKTDYGEIQVPRTDVVSITFTDTEAAKPNATPPAPAIDEALVETAYVNHTAGFQVTVPRGWRLWKEMPKGNGTVAALISEDQTLFFIGTSDKRSPAIWRPTRCSRKHNSNPLSPIMKNLQRPKLRWTGGTACSWFSMGKIRTSREFI